MVEKPSCLLLSAKTCHDLGIRDCSNPLQPKHVWSIRVRLEISRKWRDLALFNLAIDSKLRACDLVKLRLDEVCSGAKVRDRATIVQKKTGRPVQFEITEQPRVSVEAWLRTVRTTGRRKLFPRTAQRALINLAIEDAMTGEESSCKKCFP
jgi:hypothetical protein